MRPPQLSVSIHSMSENIACHICVPCCLSPFFTVVVIIFIVGTINDTVLLGPFLLLLLSFVIVGSMCRELLLGKTQQQLICQERHTAIGYNTNKRHMQTRIEPHYTLLPPYPLYSRHQPRVQSITCIHHTRPNHLMRIGRHGRNSLGNTTAQQQIHRRFDTILTTMPGLLLAPFIDWKLHSDMGQSHHAGSEAAPENPNATLAIQITNCPNNRCGPLVGHGIRSGTVQCVCLKTSPYEKHGIAYQISHRSGSNGGCTMNHGWWQHPWSALLIGIILLLLLCMLPLNQRLLNVIIEWKVDTPKERDSSECGT